MDINLHTGLKINMYTVTAMMIQCEIQKTLEPKLVHYLLFRHGVI